MISCPNSRIITSFIKNRSTDFAVTAHFLESGHAIDNIDVLLHEEHFLNRRSALKMLEIYEHRGKNYIRINKFISELGFSKEAVCVFLIFRVIECFPFYS